MTVSSGFESLGGHVIPNISTASSDDPVEFTASLNGYESRYLPTTSDHRFTKLELSLESSHLVLVSRPPMLLEGTVLSDHGVVGFYLEDDPKAGVNGSTVNDQTIALWKRGTDYRGFQHSRLTHCSLFIADAFSVRDWPEPASAGRILWIGADNRSSLRSCVSDLSEIIRKDPARLTNPNVLKGIEQSLAGLLDDALAMVARPIGGRSTGRHLAICKRAQEYLRESCFSVQSNVEIAKACDVHVRTLHNALVSVLGVSLRQYLLHHRLWRVRNALLAASADALVKSIALDHGFWHLGRFSKTYNLRFGESPSMTLAKRSSQR